MYIGRFSFFMLFLVLCNPAMAVEKIENHIDIAVPISADGYSPNLDQVKRSIIAGCRKKGWSTSAENDGEIVASILVRDRYFSEVLIAYDAEKYSIVYKDSRDLDYVDEDNTIHRNYNKWVYLLSSAILSQFGVNRRAW